jgi:DNA-binding protein HU-beta
VNKSELIEAVAARLNADHKSTAAVVDGALDEITRALVKGDRVVLTGFGTFEKRARPARTARNPRTGETVKVKKTSAPAFKAGAKLKSYVSGAAKLAKATPVKKVAPAKKAAAKTTAAATARKPAAKKATTSAAKRTAAKAAPATRTAAKKGPAKRVARKTAR